MNDLLRRLLALPEQGTNLAQQVDDLHFFVITVTMLGATIVGITALAFLIRYRRRAKDELTEHVKAPFVLEVVWIAGLLGLFLFWWVIGFQRYIAIQTPPDDSVEVYVTGKQWMWKFAYPDGRSSVNVLTVPAGRPVKLYMTSRDVIHSFYVPAFRIKQDVLPGRYTTAWFQAEEPGNYQILCAEYCGVSHSRMLGEVVALSATDYEQWLEGGEPMMVATAERGAEADQTREVKAARTEPLGFPAPTPVPTMAARGREVAVKHGCFNCHTTDGRRHIGPTWLELFGRRVTLQNGETVVADAAYLTHSMMDPTAQVVAGFVPVMPTYQGQLKAPEAAALVEFIKSLRGDGTNQMAPLPAGSLPAPTEAPGSVAPGALPVPAPAPGGAAAEGQGVSAQRGRDLAQRYGCLSCHTTDGRRHIGPSWAGVYDSEVHLETGERVHADEAYLRESMLHPKAKVVAGFSPVMPSYDGLLQEEQVDSLVAYIKSLRSVGGQAR